MVRHAGPEAAATSPASQRPHGAPARVQQHGRRVAALPAHAEHAVPAAHAFDIEVVAQGPALPVPAAHEREVVAAGVARHRLQRIVQPALRLRLVRLAQVDLRACGTQTRSRFRWTARVLVGARTVQTCAIVSGTWLRPGKDLALEAMYTGARDARCTSHYMHAGSR